MGLRDFVVEGPASIGATMRRRRWSLLTETFPDLADYRVLDLGGTADSWIRAEIRPQSVTLLNLSPLELTASAIADNPPAWMSLVAGDACDPPEVVRRQQFDLVFSNSLIEHVGGPLQRQALAGFTRSAAPRYWIQTPYRYFPLEPHWLFPMFQFLPLNIKAWLSRRWPLMHTRSSSWDEAVATSLSVELLSLTELRYLYPDAEVLVERLAGLPKSVIAIRT